MKTMKNSIKQTSNLALLPSSVLPSPNPSTLSLHPWFVTGFIDAEGCFIIGINKEDRRKTGYRVTPGLKISLHQKDLALLESIKKIFNGVGSITKHGKNTIQYRVESVKYLKVIMDHFSKYPLVTQKRADYELFKVVVALKNNGEHSTLSGLQKILSIKASHNNGLSDVLKAAFPDVLAVPRPLVVDQEIKDPNWLAGFVSGDGCFEVSILKSKTTKSGYQICLRFTVSQHSRDAELLQSLANYLACGVYYPGSGRAEGSFIVTRFLDITDKIIPFFEKFRVLGVKAQDYEDFCKAAEILKEKGHLNQSGLEQIRLIKAGMNTGRD